MKHEIYRIRSFKVVRPYTVTITYDDGFSNTIDFRPVLFGSMYGPLQNLELFNAVALDPEVHTLVWPNGADFDPELLHNWDRYSEELEERARAWETTT